MIWCQKVFLLDSLLLGAEGGISGCGERKLRREVIGITAKSYYKFSQGLIFPRSMKMMTTSKKSVKFVSELCDQSF